MKPTINFTFMNSSFYKIAARVLVSLSVLLLLLSVACSRSTPAETEPGSSPAVPVEIAPSSEAPPADEPAAGSSVPVVLVAAEESLVSLGFLDLLVSELASEGYETVFSPTLTESSLPENTAYILSSSSSSIQVDQALLDPPVLILDPSDPSRNTGNVLALSDYFYQQTAFLAGYISALFTPDYRTAYVDLVGSEIPGVYQSFGSGSRYFCGLCSPQFPPFTAYPIYIQISEPFTQEKITAVVEAMLSASVSTAYLHPHLHSQDLILAFENAGIVSISNQGLILQGDHDADLILGPDFASLIPHIVPSILNGSIPDPATPLPALLVNRDVLSPGRLQHLDEIIGMLGSGTILPVE